MGTHCIVAKPAGDGWVGRYVQYDGYPAHAVPALLTIVEEHGLEEARRVLVDSADKGGWSAVDPGVSESLARPGLHDYVPGFGLRYTDTDDYYFRSEGNDIEHYVYVLADHGLLCYEARALVRTAAWRERPCSDCGAIPCGYPGECGVSSRSDVHAS